MRDLTIVPHNLTTYNSLGFRSSLPSNKPFSEWAEIFPNATSLVTLIDRLTHRAEIIHIDADSYRLKAAKQRSADKA